MELAELAQPPPALRCCRCWEILIYQSGPWSEGSSQRGRPLRGDGSFVVTFGDESRDLAAAFSGTIGACTLTAREPGGRLVVARAGDGLRCGPSAAERKASSASDVGSGGGGSFGGGGAGSLTTTIEQPGLFFVLSTWTPSRKAAQIGSMHNLEFRQNINTKITE